MKIVDGLLNKVLETGSDKEIFVYLKTHHEFLKHEVLQGKVTAIDPNAGSILMESTDESYTLCFLVNLNDVSYISYFKCNGLII